jgi:hypothetical protein
MWLIVVWCTSFCRHCHPCRIDVAIAVAVAVTIAVVAVIAKNIVIVIVISPLPKQGG